MARACVGGDDVSIRAASVGFDALERKHRQRGREFLGGNGLPALPHEHGIGRFEMPERRDERHLAAGECSQDTIRVIARLAGDHGADRDRGVQNEVSHLQAPEFDVVLDRRRIEFLFRTKRAGLG